MQPINEYLHHCTLKKGRDGGVERGREGGREGWRGGERGREGVREGDQTSNHKTVQCKNPSTTYCLDLNFLH